MKKERVIIIGCLLAACCLACLFVLKTKQAPRVSISIDKYTESRDNARKEADNARKEWESHEQERAAAELARLKEMDVPDLAKKAVGILARSDDPQFVVNKSIVKTEEVLGESVTVQPFDASTLPENKRFWTIVARETVDDCHDWWLEQNKWFDQYRLAEKRVVDNEIILPLYFSIKKEAKLKTVLAYIVIFGNIKPFYQVSLDGMGSPKLGCEILSMSDAKKIFPETMELDEGVYARHPCNKYALVPVMDFHAKLAMDKATECIVLLGRMGAKSVCVSRTKGEMSDVEGGAGASIYGYNAKINSALASAMKSKMELRVVFQGRPNADISLSLLENSIWHKSDARLNGILQTILSGNKPKEWSTVEEDQSDFNFDFKAAAGVLHIAEAELRAKFEKSRQTQREFHVTF